MSKLTIETLLKAKEKLLGNLGTSPKPIKIVFGNHTKQTKFPRAKSRRIRKKWRKNLKNHSPCEYKYENARVIVFFVHYSFKPLLDNYKLNS